MVARINLILNHDVEPMCPTRPKGNYFKSKNETDYFPDPSLLDPIYLNQHEDIRQAPKINKKEARENGLTDPYSIDLDNLLD